MDLTPATALVMVAVCASGSDKEISQEEKNRIVSLAWCHPMFENKPIEAIDQVVDEVIDALLAQGMDQSLDTAGKALPEALKETAYAWAVDVVLADEWVELGEKQLLEEIRTRFTIKPKIARKIFEVCQIRNRIADTR